jgi:uncharacterized protein YecE (DUF72 family)
MPQGTIRIGTASWTDPGFVADWYPPRLPPEMRLRWYSRHLDLVEVNATFYALPSPFVTRQWVERTPNGFLFDIKLHRFFSRHAIDPFALPRDLRPRVDVVDGKVAWNPALEDVLLERFLDGISPLMAKQRLGALLLQMSPAFSPRKHALTELDSLLNRLSAYRVAVELRHREWMEPGRIEDTVAFFALRRAALVSVDAPRVSHFMAMPPIDVVTDPRQAYLRAHGRNAKGFASGRTVADRFDYRYSEAELRELGERAATLAESAGEVHVIFNNNRSSYAPEAAEALKRMLGQEVGGRLRGMRG